MVDVDTSFFERKGRTGFVQLKELRLRAAVSSSFERSKTLSLKEAMAVVDLCWPAIILVSTVIFLLGCWIGSSRRKDERDYGLKKKNCSAAEVENYLQQRLKSLWDLNEEEDETSGSEGEIVLFMTRLGAKAHFTPQCPGLNPTDLTQITTKTLCKFCRRKRRVGPLKTR